MKKMLTELGTLFGINEVLNKAFVAAQMEVFSPDVFRSLQVCKERLLKNLRPLLINIIDGIGLPDRVIRSHITTENMYEVGFSANEGTFEEGQASRAEQGSHPGSNDRQVHSQYDAAPLMYMYTEIDK